MNVEVRLIPALSDNYIYLLHWDSNAVIVDPAEAPPVLQALEEGNLSLLNILNTHHHFDHVAGNVQIKTEMLVRKNHIDQPPRLCYGRLGEGERACPSAWTSGPRGEIRPSAKTLRDRRAEGAAGIRTSPDTRLHAGSARR